MDTARLSITQGVIITGFTGVPACDFSDFHKDAERRLGRPVWTHEFGNREMKVKLKELYRDDFVAMCAERSPA